MPTLNRSPSAPSTSTPAPFLKTPAQQPTTPRPTIILVHGGWQGPETFSLLIPLLELASYSIFAVTLPSSGTVPAVADFSLDVAAVRNAVSSTIATGKDVLLVLHSYGAVVGCEALKGIKVDEATRVVESEGQLRVGRVVKVAFIAGLLFPEGKATLPMSKGTEATAGFECEDNLIRVLDGPRRFYNDLPPSEAAQWASRLKRHSRLAFASPLTYAPYRDFPTSYLLCTHDNGVPLAVQKRFVAMAGITDVTQVDAGHSPMVSRPKAVERFVRRSAGEVAAKL
ncbi:MAG: hypothetical protein Q9184_008143 [Pyrenodesmia sp. 2 TL-2023]